MSTRGRDAEIVRQSVFSDRRGMFSRDRSLDRQLDRHHKNSEQFNSYPVAETYMSTSNLENRDYSAYWIGYGEREYKGGAPNLVRSRSIDPEIQDLLPDYAFADYTFSAAGDDNQRARNVAVLDVQLQLTNLTRECNILRQTLDSTREKLASSMNSVKTFWSPELKKERFLRKEELSRSSMLSEQLKVIQGENQKLASRLGQLEEVVRQSHGDVVGRLTSPSARLSQDGSGGKGSPSVLPRHGVDGNGKGSPSSDSVDNIKRDKDRLVKEAALLRKTLEEMELRAEVQKQTLAAREESIKKLLGMLQNKGLSVKQLEDDRLEFEKLQVKCSEDERSIRRLESLLELKNREIEEIKANRIPGDNIVLQTLLEAKDIRINSLEKESKAMEEQMLRLREMGLMVNDQEARNCLYNQLETIRGQERATKQKLDTMKNDLAHRDSELSALKAKLDAMTKQDADHQQHIDVLKEQILSKDKQASLLLADIENVRERLREREATVDSKTKLAVNELSEKKKLECDVRELKDQLDLKERKVSILQRKVDSLEELVKDKEVKIAAIQSKVVALQTPSQAIPNTSIGELQEVILEKEHQLTKLQEQREQSERDHQQEVNVLQKTNKECSVKLDTLQTLLAEKEALLKHQMGEVLNSNTDRLNIESKLKKVEFDLATKVEEVCQLQAQLKKVVEEKVPDSSHNELQKRETEAGYKVIALQGEIAKLQDLLKLQESEKSQFLDTIRKLKVEKSQANDSLLRLESERSQALETQRKVEAERDSLLLVQETVQKLETEKLQMIDCIHQLEIDKLQLQNNQCSFETEKCSLQESLKCAEFELNKLMELKKLNSDNSIFKEIAMQHESDRNHLREALSACENEKIKLQSEIKIAETKIANMQDELRLAASDKVKLEEILQQANHDLQHFKELQRQHHVDMSKQQESTKLMQIEKSKLEELVLSTEVEQKSKADFIHVLESELKQMQERVRQLESDKSCLEESMREINTDRNCLREILLQKDESMKQGNLDKNHAFELVHKVEAERMSLIEKINLLESEKVRLQELVKNTEGNSFKLQQLTIDNNSLNNALKKLEKELLQSQETIELVKKENARLNDSLRRLDNERTQLLEVQNRADVERDKFAELLSQMESERLKMQESLKQIDAERTKANFSLRQVDGENAKLHEHLKQLESERNHLKEKLQQMKTECEQMKDALQLYGENEAKKQQEKQELLQKVDFERREMLQQFDVERQLMEKENVKHIITCKSAQEALETSNSEKAVLQDSVRLLESENLKLKDALNLNDKAIRGRDKKVLELEQIKQEYQTTISNLKIAQENDKKKHTQLQDEIRRQEEASVGGSLELKARFAEKENRVKELEEALRESIKITAEREIVVADQQMRLDRAEKDAWVTNAELDRIKKEREELTLKLAATKRETEEKDKILVTLQEDRKKHLAEVFEMKQEAMFAAMSEKDANIALLELLPHKKTGNIDEVEKLMREKRQLQQELRQLTEQQMQLKQEIGHIDTQKSRSSPKSQSVHNDRMKP